MTAPRVQTKEIEKERRQGQARPVDSYSIPQQSGLQELAQGLAEISQPVSDLSVLLAERQKRADEQRGFASAEEFRSQAQTLQEAIKKGLIKDYDSPVFRLAAQEQFGRIAADRLNASVIEDMQNGQLASSENPDDFDARITELREEALQGLNADAAFINGFAPRSSAHIENARRQFTSEAGARLRGRVEEQTFMEQYQTVLDGFNRELDPGVIAEGLNITNDRNIKTGLDAKTSNELTIEAVVRAAIEQRDSSILDILDHVRGGSGFLSKTKSGIAKIDQARQIIASRKMEEWSRERQMADAARTDAVREVSRGYVTEILDAMKNGRSILSVDLTSYQTQLADIDATAASNLGRLQASFLGDQDVTDSNVLSAAIRRIYSNTDPNSVGYFDIQDAIGLSAAGSIAVADFEKLLRHLDTRDSAATAGASDKDRYINDLRNRSLTRIRSQLGVSDMPLDDEERAYAWRAAEIEMMDWYLTMLDSGEFGKMTLDQIHKSIAAHEEFVIQDIKQRFSDVIEIDLETTKPEDVSSSERIPLIGDNPAWHKWYSQPMMEPVAYQRLQQIVDEAALRGEQFSAALLPGDIIDVLIAAGLTEETVEEDFEKFFRWQSQFFTRP